MASSRATRLLKIRPSRCCDCPSVANRGSRFAGFDSISSVKAERCARTLREHPAGPSTEADKRQQATLNKQPTVIPTGAGRRLFFFFAPAKESPCAAEGPLLDASRKPRKVNCSVKLRLDLLAKLSSRRRITNLPQNRRPTRPRCRKNIPRSLMKTFISQQRERKRFFRFLRPPKPRRGNHLHGRQSGRQLTHDQRIPRPAARHNELIDLHPWNHKPVQRIHHRKRRKNCRAANQILRLRSKPPPQCQHLLQIISSVVFAS